MTSFHAEYAWLGDETAAREVLIEVTDGVITSVSADATRPEGAVRLAGLTLPGLVNTHSHVFHRAIRGHTESAAADFWAWRELMYRVAGRLDPDSLYALARATYAEMALAGITTVGEFHYLHHGPDGARYADPNELGAAVRRGAADAGVRLTLLDTCYLQADVNGTALGGVQRRFDDGSWRAWAERTGALTDDPSVRIGAAIHSVRAVPRTALQPIAQTVRQRGAPLHLHLSEQPAENAATQAAFGRTPTQVMAEAGVLGAATTAVHATHLTAPDIALLGGSGTSISMCVTTERDLADGIGPARALATAGCPIVLGTDGHMMIDMFEEARGVELDERLATGRRGHFTVPELLSAATSAGAASLGWNAGRIAPGALADLTTVALDTPRTARARAGDPLAAALYSATSADVRTVVVGGTVIVQDGRHRSVEDVGGALADAISAVLT
ncbi:MAG: formimidoylglutamate deiminase [Jatrophihabitans sp.]